MKRETQPDGPPAAFLSKMQHLLLPDDYTQFAAAYQQPGRIGLRVNTLKIAATDFSTLSPFPLEALGPWETAGFLTDEDARPGRHPYHEAGLYYVQEPSAMLPAALLAPEPGERVLDLAAAPGGKSTQLLSRLDSGEQAGSVLRRTLNAPGLLVANDIHSERATILAENLARWGAANAVVLNSEPERLAETLGATFDRVLVDAPCSGEGMFRRQGGFEWSESMVLACSRRQKTILDAAARLVRPGGRLVYSTCTFSPEENEQVIATFLGNHPSFVLIDLPRHPGWSAGVADWAPDSPAALERAVRLWPHRFPGEGHFAAALQRESGPAEQARRPSAFPVRPPGKVERENWRRFAQEALVPELPQTRLHAAAGRLYLLPEETIGLGSLRLVRYGIPLGELRAGYFRPSHDLALTLQAEDAVHSVDWTADAPRLAAFLGGRDIDDAGPNGWTLVTVEGFGIGWAKRVGGRLKNHYPRRLRRP